MRARNPDHGSVPCAGASSKGRLLFSIALTASLALFTVYLNVSAVQTGYRVERVRREQAKLRDENARLRADVGQLLVPERVAERLAGMDLPLVGPDGTRLAGWQRASEGHFAAAGER